MFDVASCHAAAGAGRLEDWLHCYLRAGPWANLGLSDGLRRCPRHWIGPVLLRLDALDRCCGPEPKMKYREDAEAWHRRVAAMAAGLTQPAALPPLVVEWRGDRLSVRDGSHRHAAATLIGWPALWAVVWFSDSADNGAVEQAVARAVACTIAGIGTTLADTAPSDRSAERGGTTIHARYA